MRPTTFLNVDLVLAADRPLDLIADFLEKDVSTLFCGPYPSGFRATFEVNFEPESADAAMGAFCELIESFDEPTQKLWDACTGRELDIGFEAGAASLETLIRPQTIARLARLGAGIRITIYPPVPEDEHDEDPPVA